MSSRDKVLLCPSPQYAVGHTTGITKVTIAQYPHKSAPKLGFLTSVRHQTRLCVLHPNLCASVDTSSGKSEGTPIIRVSIKNREMVLLSL